MTLSLSPEVLEQLLAMSKRLTSRRDLDGLLHDILDGSLQLIPGADFACVFLYRGEENVLVPVGGVGFDMTYMRTVWLKPGESLTGQAFVEKKPLLLATPRAVKSAQKTLSPEHERAVKLAVGRPDNPVRSSLAVPLIVESRTVGVLVIDNYDTDRDFNSVDLTVATILADHAAIAVANAQDYHRAQTLSHELQQTLSVQSKLLSSMLTPNAGFPEILGTLWHLIRRPQAIYDRDHHLLAHQGGTVGDAKHHEIRSGRQELGYLVVGGEPLSRVESVTVEQALPLMALEFMKILASEQQQDQTRATLFRDVMASDSVALRHLVHQYGLRDTTWHVVLMASQEERARTQLTHQLREVNAPFTIMETAIMVIANPSVLPLLHQWQGQHPQVTIWGERGSSALEIPEQLGATWALWKIVAHNAEFLVRVPQMEFHLRDYPEIVLLETLLPAQRDAYLTKILAPILGDAESVKTLRAWILLNRSFKLTAECLHTHPNTIRYRIDRIGDLLERNFQNDQDVMSVRLAVLWMGPSDTNSL